jgi:hypothetical protein
LLWKSSGVSSTPRFIAGYCLEDYGRDTVLFVEVTMAIAVVCEAIGATAFNTGLVIVVGRGASLKSVEKRARQAARYARKKKDHTSESVKQAVKKALVGKARVFEHETIYI